MEDSIVNYFNYNLKNEYYFIYKTINLVNNMFYIGQHHTYTSAFDGYLGSGTYLQSSIKKYGKEK